MNKKITIIILVILLTVFVGAYLIKQKDPRIPITIYKTQSCGCCEGFISELTKGGFDVKMNVEDNIDIKGKYNIPEEMRSCHTSFVKGYFVEGHVPLEAINKLIEESPEIDGIALPGMPSGSLGMPGIKDGRLKIYSITNGTASIFMEI
ncbi:MAG: DUF411 domain-containing protein [Candidatus Pacearchaeota archaeon]